MITSDEVFWERLSAVRIDFRNLCLFCEEFLCGSVHSVERDSCLCFTPSNQLEAYEQVYRLCCYGYVSAAGGKSLNILYETVCEMYASWVCGLLASSTERSEETLCRMIRLVLRWTCFRFKYLNLAYVDPAGGSISVIIALHQITNGILFSCPKTLWPMLSQRVVSALTAENPEDRGRMVDAMTATMELLKDCRATFPKESVDYICGELQIYAASRGEKRFRHWSAVNSPIQYFCEALHWCENLQCFLKTHFENLLPIVALDKVNVTESIERFLVLYLSGQDEALHRLLVSRQVTDLRMIRNCVCRVSGDLSLHAFTEAFVKSFLKAITGAAIEGRPREAAVEYVEGLLAVYRNYADMTERIEAPHSVCVRLKVALQEILHRPLNATPYCLVRYLHEKAFRTRTSEESGTYDDGVFMLLSTLSEKDLFLDMFKLSLCHRLLREIPQHEVERELLAKLCPILGLHAVRLLRSILDDHGCAQEEPQLVEGLHVCVLAQGKWPAQLTSAVATALPPQDPAMVALLNEFEATYARKYPSRRLLWLHHVGVCEVISSHDRVSITGTVGAASVFLSFNTNSSVDKSMVPQGLLQNNKLFIEDPEDNTRLRLSPVLFAEATSKKRWSRVSVVGDPVGFHSLLKDASTAASEGEAVRGLELQRTLQIEAAIVRVLKARKEGLQLQDLVTEVQRALVYSLFVPNREAVRRGVLRLAERSFVGVADSESNVTYLP